METAWSWWLRGPSVYSYGNLMTPFVNYAGEIKTYYPTYDKGIRPVIRVNKDAKELFL